MLPLMKNGLKIRLLRAVLALHFLGVTLAPYVVMANPSGEQVVAGSAQFERSVDRLNITTSEQVIINWQDFSIGSNETTQFIQPGSSSLAVNRVVTGNPSAIYGTLSGNGRIVVLNPNGIMVGAGGVVDTGGDFWLRLWRWRMGVFSPVEIGHFKVPPRRRW
ncbi:MAG: filamentous hemagglutinin N-terminal domain-containing protein [Blastochloris sp.]|nr:filamentous hemagglutinin N-terminal domain-containing protein [Blastochloris sp.]